MGIIICKEKNKIVVEYSLKTFNLPIGVDTYEISIKLPKKFKNILLSKEMIVENINLFFVNET
ncbi:PDDEXK nuclease domain-containing protein [Methanobrevibacter cuticularis]|uniref:PDDEXK nuclease domain-containing protein n=1 Tax=Methanobrevibacter cuticularis TaxID=47311 RepID=UPI00373FE425